MTVHESMPSPRCTCSRYFGSINSPGNIRTDCEIFLYWKLDEVCFDGSVGLAQLDNVFREVRQTPQIARRSERIQELKLSIAILLPCDWLFL